MPAILALGVALSGINAVPAAAHSCPRPVGMAFINAGFAGMVILFVQRRRTDPA